jgi:hypothetical protein
VVGVDAANDMNVVGLAEQKLIARVRRSIDAIDVGGFKSGMEIEQVRNTPFRVWHERTALHDPSGSYLGMGHKVCIAVPPDSHQRIHDIANNLPSLIEGIQIWLQPWSEAPGRERN